jgi:hypothetical protein
LSRNCGASFCAAQQKFPETPLRAFAVFLNNSTVRKEMEDNYDPDGPRDYLWYRVTASGRQRLLGK